MVLLYFEWIILIVLELKDSDCVLFDVFGYCWIKESELYFYLGVLIYALERNGQDPEKVRNQTLQKLEKLLPCIGRRDHSSHFHCVTRKRCSCRICLDPLAVFYGDVRCFGSLVSSDPDLWSRIKIA